MKPVIDAVVAGLNPQCGPDARRLFHGRGQCYESLGYINVDWFKPVLLITLYQPPEPQNWQQLLDGLADITPRVSCAFVQRRFIRGGPIEILWGEPLNNPVATEQGLSYALAFGGKQNIGFFLDMSPGRQWLRDCSKNKRVLNLFSYTCSFSVAAMAGNARSVLNVDMSKAALQVGRDNHRLNNMQDKLRRDVQFLSYDIFRSWKKIVSKGPYDIVIIDPPSRQKGSFIAEKDYARVVRKLKDLLPEGGDILSCLNAPAIADDFLHDVFAKECPDADFVKRLENRADFPEADNARNLKMLHFNL